MIFRCQCFGKMFRRSAFLKRAITKSGANAFIKALERFSRTSIKSEASIMPEDGCKNQIPFALKKKSGSKKKFWHGLESAREKTTYRSISGSILK